MSETYHYGQGKIELAEIINGVLGEWIWIGDASELTGNFSEEELRHQESFSGQKGTARKFGLGKTLTWNATLFQLDTVNVARFTDGTATETAAGTVTGESLGTVTAGSVLQLDHMGVSDLVLTDSTTPTPATIAASHYEYDEFGEVKILSLPSGPAPVMPLRAAYSHSGYKQGAFLNAPRKNYALRFRGVNLAEESKKVQLDLYKVAPGLLQTLSMITSGNQLASAPVTFEMLIDTSKPAGGAMGQYGRLITIDY